MRFFTDEQKSDTLFPEVALKKLSEKPKKTSTNVFAVKWRRKAVWYKLFLEEN